MLRKKSSKRRKNINASSTIDFFLHIRADEAVFLQNLFCALAQFHFFEAFSEDQHLSLSCAIDAIWCMMLCYVKWCDDVMLCKMISVPKTHTHIPIVEYTISLPLIFRLHRLFFGVSALTFRCKFCIPLGTTFCSFGKLTLRSLERLFVASANLRCVP